MKIVRTRVYRFELPFRKPVVLHRETLHTRVGCLLCLEADNGLEGWGEASPLPGFSRESQDEALQALVDRAGKLRDCSLVDAFALRRASVLCASASFALETAVLRLAAGVLEIPLRRIMAEHSAEIIRVCALLPNGRARTGRKARTRSSQKYAAVKLKVGRGSLADDMTTVREVREALGPDVALRLDANRAWDLDTAVCFAHETASCDIAYIEEPLRNWRDLSAYSRACPVPYALDETLQDHRDYLAALLMSGERNPDTDLARVLQGAHAWVVKPSLMHFHGLVEWLRGVKAPPYVVISAAYESGVGISTLAHYAAAISGPDVAVGLDTYQALGKDVLREALPGGGEMRMAQLDKPIEIDANCLECVWDG